MNSTQRTHASLLAFLCFFGGAAGSLLASLVKRESAPPLPPPALPAPDPLPAIAQVLAELRQLRSEASTPKDARAVANGPEGNELAALVERLAKLTAALEERAAPRTANTPAARSKFDLLPEARTAADGDYAFTDFSTKDQELTSKHLLWSLQDVVREYGGPNEVSSNQGTIFLIYRLEPSRHRVVFGLCNGAVVSVRLG